MDFKHYSVLLPETIEQLHIKEDGIYVDGTLGGGGHSYEIAKRLTTGRLIGIDQDYDALEAAGERLRPFADRVTLVHSNYEAMVERVHELGIDKVDGILLDLGVSSFQLDTPERGFSYMVEDAPLDMRMDQDNPMTAADIVNDYSEEDLYRIIRDYGEDRFAKNIAKNIVKERQKERITRAGQLNQIIERSIPKKLQVTGGHPAKRTYQAIRIELNRELDVLEQNLDTVLFKRSSRGVTLTPDGELLFEKVKEALSLLDEGENSIRHNRSRDIPKLRLGASSTLTRYVLLSHLKNYIARFPHVRITISCQSTYQTLQLLDEEKIDLGLIGRPQKLRGYYFQPLLKIQDTFVCTQQYLENQKQLYPDEPLVQAATFMMLDEDNITRQTVNSQLKEHHVELSHILEVTTMDLLIQFAEIGLGIACVIRDFVKKELEEGTLVEVPIGFSFPLREIGFVCRQKDADSALIAPFFDDETGHPDR
jgi:16S rRNA (cytosine(1402)-N(4))-methyltransferase